MYFDMNVVVRLGKYGYTANVEKYFVYLDIVN